VDDAFTQLLLDNEVIYVPTLMVGERYRETFFQKLDLTVAEHRLGQKDVIASLFDLRTVPDSLVPGRFRKAIAADPLVPADSIAIRNLRTVYEAGVTVAAGTDAGNIGTPHGPALSREFELMAAAGLSPAEILETATTGGAALMGRDDIGAVEPGMQADLLILNANPLDDAQNAFDIDAVVHRGTITKHSYLAKRTPEEAAQQQLNAYNAQDIDGFLDAYADSVHIYQYPNQAQGGGIDAMRENYTRLFERAPELFANVTNRMVQGRFVIDYEEVTGISSDGSVTTVIAIYHVNEDGDIDRVEFVR
jgi:hypothetical protein